MCFILIWHAKVCRQQVMLWCMLSSDNYFHDFVIFGLYCDTIHDISSLSLKQLYGLATLRNDDSMVVIFIIFMHVYPQALSAQPSIVIISCIQPSVNPSFSLVVCLTSHPERFYLWLLTNFRYQARTMIKSLLKSYTQSFYTPRFNQVQRGVYWFHLARLTICRSVCLSVGRVVSDLYLQWYSSDLFYILTNSLNL